MATSCARSPTTQGCRWPRSGGGRRPSEKKGSVPVFSGEGGRVDRPGGAGGVEPGPGGWGGGGALGGGGGGEEAGEVVGVDEGGAVVENLAEGGDVAGDDGGSAGQGLDGGEAEALVIGGEDERAGAGVDGGEVVVGDHARQGDVGELVGPFLRRADEDEREIARRLGEGGDALARIGGLEAADPDHVVGRQRVAAADVGDLVVAAGAHSGRGRLRDDDDPVALDVEELDRVK